MCLPSEEPHNIPGFMIQGGYPSDTGKSGKSIYGEPFDNEIREHLKHSDRCVVSMANGGPKSNR
jgi:peptidyl-prolyl cis-trans isomerase-like 3